MNQYVHESKSLGGTLAFRNICIDPLEGGFDSLSDGPRVPRWCCVIYLLESGGAAWHSEKNRPAAEKSTGAARRCTVITWRLSALFIHSAHFDPTTPPWILFLAQIGQKPQLPPAITRQGANNKVITCAVTLSDTVEFDSSAWCVQIFSSLP